MRTKHLLAWEWELALALAKVLEPVWGLVLVSESQWDNNLS